MEINWILTIVWLHFIGDFILQTDKMALNKSKELKWVVLHGLVYSIPMLYIGFTFAIINGLLHLVVDFFSSKLTTHLWVTGKRHWFFVVIGLDQAIHFTMLLWVYKYLSI